MLAVRGEDVMRIAKIEPSLKVGQILAALLEEVLEEPEKNTKEHLEARITELAKLSDKKLAELKESSRKKKEEFEERRGRRD